MWLTTNVYLEPPYQISDTLKNINFSNLTYSIIHFSAFELYVPDILHNIASLHPRSWCSSKLWNVQTCQIIMEINENPQYTFLKMLTG